MIDEATLEAVEEIIEEWRQRLFDMGWFMRGINETIARMANKEENIKGRFWEGRYKSQALLDEAAVLSCMTYVDLNPVRAAMTDDVSTSDFTSIQQRLFDYSLSQKSQRKGNKTKTEKTVAKKIQQQQQLKVEQELDDLPEAPLMPFSGSSHVDIHLALPFTREDYFELVDATGRVVREDKRGAIPNHIVPILERVGIESSQWIEQIQYFDKSYGCCAGSPAKILEFSGKFKRRWGKGIKFSRFTYS